MKSFKKILGLDIGGTNIKAGVSVVPPEITEFKSFPTDTSAIREQIASIAKTFKPDAIGIGIAGLIGNGIVYSSPNLAKINNTSLKDFLEHKLKIPVTVENDANMYAFGEWKHGAGKGSHSMLLLTLGTGVGGGIINDNKLYTGEGFAGEIGHTTIAPDGAACECGNYGCLETFVGSAAIVLKAKQGLMLGIKTSLVKHSKITPEVISKEAYKGDKFSLSIIEGVGYYLGIGIANACAIMDPEIVVIGGGVSKAGKILFNKINDTLEKRLFLLPYTGKNKRKKLTIVPAKLGDEAGVLGSITYITDKLNIKH
ncbi:MAG: ROK family protein [bacterium]